VKGAPDQYMITVPGFKVPPGITIGPGPVLPGWGHSKNGRLAPFNPVLLTVEETMWRIRPSDDGKTYL